MISYEPVCNAIRGVPSKMIYRLLFCGKWTPCHLAAFNRQIIKWSAKFVLTIDPNHRNDSL